MTKFAGRIKQALWHPFDASHYLKLFCPWDLGDTVNCSCPTRPMQRQAAFVSMFKIYLCVLVMQSVTLKAEGADMCFHHCIKVFARRFTDSKGSSGEQTVKEHLAEKTSSEQSEQANHISSVRQACGVFVEFKTCTLTCTASLELAALEDAFEGFNFMCFERKSRFLKHATCLEDKDNQISGLCKNEIKLIELAMGTMKHMMFATSKELELSLQNLCRNTTRLVRCFLPAINAICGVDAADLMREFILLTFGKKNALYPMDNADLPGDSTACSSLLRLLKRTPFPQRTFAPSDILKDPYVTDSNWNGLGNVPVSVDERKRLSVRKPRVSSEAMKAAPAFMFLILTSLPFVMSMD